jgi:acyl carrier protein
VETALAQLWAELLELPPGRLPDRHAGFFTLGGTSLTALRLVTAVEQRFGVDVPIRRFFTTPTVAALAAEVIAATGAGSEDETGTV